MVVISDRKSLGSKIHIMASGKLFQSLMIQSKAELLIANVVPKICLKPLVLKVCDSLLREQWVGETKLSWWRIQGAMLARPKHKTQERWKRVLRVGVQRFPRQPALVSLCHCDVPPQIRSGWSRKCRTVRLAASGGKANMATACLIDSVWIQCSVARTLSWGRSSRMQSYSNSHGWHGSCWESTTSTSNHRIFARNNGSAEKQRYDTERDWFGGLHSRRGMFAGMPDNSFIWRDFIGIKPVKHLCVLLNESRNLHPFCGMFSPGLARRRPPAVSAKLDTLHFNF